MTIYEVKGLLRCGYVGECEKDNHAPCYILENTELNKPKKTIEDTADGIFICDILKRYIGKQIKITIEDL